ncbi:hypothetical protein EDB85DRAFT_2274755 [Lactarius pseudohatsudake]|nr:hypothetical protein EDB85DRAFT_2274755 [Lactarius pseudohatsudake]
MMFMKTILALSLAAFALCRSGDPATAEFCFLLLLPPLGCPPPMTPWLLLSNRNLAVNEFHHLFCVFVFWCDQKKRYFLEGDARRPLKYGATHEEESVMPYSQPLGEYLSCRRYWQKGVLARVMYTVVIKSALYRRKRVYTIDSNARKMSNKIIGVEVDGETNFEVRIKHVYAKRRVFS